MDSSCRTILRVFAVLCFLLLGWLGSVTARAHEAGLSIVEVRTHADTLELAASYALNDVQRMLPPSVRLGTDSSQHTIDAAQLELNQLASLLWDVRIDGQALVARSVNVEFTPSDNLAFRFVYPRPASGSVLFRSANIGSLPSSHREILTFVDDHGRTRLTKALTYADNTAEVSLAEMANDPVAAPVSVGQSIHPAPGFGEFFKLGIEHIWTGYDHLLFLLGLLLVCRSFRSIVLIVTSFTVAHSLTLGLATLDLVNLSPRVVEPLIAGTIVFVGVENLLRRESEPRGRAWLTFAFGLVHGFGFAGVLRDLGVGANGGGIAMPLLSFNLGVEFGQVCIAAVVLPALLWLFREEKIRKRGVIGASAVIALAGMYWLAERTFFS